MSKGPNATPNRAAAKIESKCVVCGGKISATLKRDGRSLHPWWHNDTGAQECAMTGPYGT